jgi:2-dehydropantoate 2-reductase
VLLKNAKTRSDEQRPSMAQDIFKGRRTETDFINGFVAAKGAEIGVPAPIHARMNELVKQVERGAISPGVSTLQACDAQTL